MTQGGREEKAGRTNLTMGGSEVGPWEVIWIRQGHQGRALVIKSRWLYKKYKRPEETQIYTHDPSLSLYTVLYLFRLLPVRGHYQDGHGGTHL